MEVVSNTHGYGMLWCKNFDCKILSLPTKHAATFVEWRYRFFFKQITTTSDWSFCGACCVIRLTRESHSRSVPSCIHARKKQHHQPTLHRAMIITETSHLFLYIWEYIMPCILAVWSKLRYKVWPKGYHYRRVLRMSGTPLQWLTKDSKNGHYSVVGRDSNFSE